jgi:hypothetical protein
VLSTAFELRGVDLAFLHAGKKNLGNIFFEKYFVLNVFCKQTSIIIDVLWNLDVFL